MDGCLIDSVADIPLALADRLTSHLITADTLGPPHMPYDRTKTCVWWLHAAWL